MSCLFCDIAAGTIPTRKAYEDDAVIVFHDIAPQAPVHLIAIPKKHFDSVRDVQREDGALIGYLMTIVAQLARELDLPEGFRLVVNTGPHAGQTVQHLHVHLLGGHALPMALG